MDHNEIELADKRMASAAQKPDIPLIQTTDSNLDVMTRPGTSRGDTPPSPSVQKPITAKPEEDIGREEAAVTKEEKKKVWKHRGRLLAGLILPFFLNSIDVTIVATALPHIAADFEQLSQQSWIVTAFTITATAFIPAFGQFCDVFGRHPVLQFALLLMWVGSALCTGAQTFGMLLLGRAIVGISSSGLLVVTTVILGDKVSLKENALQNTLFSLIAGVSYGVGPVIGGYLTAVHWRWCFGLSIPLSLIAHILAYFCLQPILVKAINPNLSSSSTVNHHQSYTFLQKLAVVDWEGLTFFLVACVCIILALTWGGATYAWGSPQIIILLALGGIFTIIFLLIEKGMEEDGWLKIWAAKKGDGTWLKTRRVMIPLSLYTSKDVCILSYLNFAGGVAVYSMFYFISVYFTIVFAYPPSKAGLQLLLYIPGLGGGVYAAMYMCNKYPLQTYPPLFLGTVVTVPVSLGMLTHALEIRNEGLILGMMAMSGFGYGICIMPVPLHAIARKPKQLASVVATLQFFDPLGGTVALAVMSSVLNNKVGGTGIGGLLEGAGRRESSTTGAGGPEGERLVGNVLDKLTPEMQEHVKSVVKEGVRWAFIAILPLMVVAAVLCLGLGNVDIDLRKLDDRVAEQERIEGDREEREKGRENEAEAEGASGEDEAEGEAPGEGSMEDSRKSVWDVEKLALAGYYELIRENGVWWAIGRVLRFFAW